MYFLRIMLMAKISAHLFPTLLELLSFSLFWRAQFLREMSKRSPPPPSSHPPPSVTVLTPRTVLFCSCCRNLIWKKHFLLIWWSWKIIIDCIRFLADKGKLNVLYIYMSNKAYISVCLTGALELRGSVTHTS